MMSTCNIPQVDDTVDVRLQMPWDEQQPDWSHEEIWNLITLDGTAASPENIPLTVRRDLMGLLQSRGSPHIQRHFPVSKSWLLPVEAVRILR